MRVKLWVDDAREPPDRTWDWARTSKHALRLLDYCWADDRVWIPLEAISLDHDLGGDDTTRPIVLWMIENNVWFDEVLVHTANPVGREWLEGTIARYKPGETNGTV